MISELIYMFSFPFIQRALIVGVLVTLCSSLLGVSLVLKRYSMIGDGLSHVGFGALAVSAVLGTKDLAIAIPVVVAAAFILLQLSENNRFKGDSAVAIISTTALAFGVFIVSKSGSNTDLSNYMFGSILSVNTFDTVLSIIISTIVLILFLLFYPRIFAVTFDESFAKATGVKVHIFNMLLAVLTALTIVVGMRMMGTLLISSLIVFPPISAMRLFKNFKMVTIASAVISVVCFLLGLFYSYFYSAPTGASIVIVNALVMIICFIIRKIINFSKKRKN